MATPSESTGIAKYLTLEETKRLLKMYRDLHVAVSQLDPNVFPCTLGPNPFRGLDDDEALGSTEVKFVVDVYPGGPIYGSEAVRFEIILTSTYPLTPPLIRVTGKMFHPNVDTQGQVCAPFLIQGQGHNSSTSLMDYIRHMHDLLVNPNVHCNPQNPEALRLYQENSAEYINRAKIEFSKNK